MKTLFVAIFSLFLGLSMSHSAQADEKKAEIKKLEAEIKEQEARVLDEAQGMMDVFYYDGILKDRKKKIADIKKEFSYGLGTKSDDKIKKLNQRLTRLKLLDGRPGNSDMKKLSEFINKTYADGSRGQNKFFESEDEFGTKTSSEASNI